MKDLTALTVGERFWLDRTRRGETQAEAGARLGISERHYLRIERDRVWHSRRPPQRRPTLGQQCALARRRDGRDLRFLATWLGVGSHVTLLAWEAAGDRRLVDEWMKVGYRFS